MIDCCILHVEDDSNDILFLDLAFRDVGITMRVQSASINKLF